MSASLKTAALGFLAVALLSGCGLFNNARWNGNDPDAVRRAEDPYGTDPKYAEPDLNSRETDRQSNGMVSYFFGGSDKKAAISGGGAPGIGVNSYLWRASLDTVSFMPLASADPFGGVIITDWYSPPQTPDERFKVNVFILDRQLRADGVRATVFHQRRDAHGQWVEAPVDAKTGTDLENSILTRARQLRLSTVQAAQ